MLRLRHSKPLQHPPLQHPPLQAMSGIERRRASRQTHPYYHHHYYNYYGGGGWNTASGCRPGWTVQGGVCKPYRYGPWDIYGGRQSDYGY